MIRAVFDTNVLAAGAVAPAGTTLAQLIDAVGDGRVDLAVSEPILIELRRTLARPYYTARLSPTTAAAYVRTLVALSSFVPLTAPVHGVATHPEDDLILATAVSAHADYLVTGDQPLRRVGSIHDIPIVSPADFLEALMKGGISR